MGTPDVDTFFFKCYLKCRFFNFLKCFYKMNLKKTLFPNVLSDDSCPGSQWESGRDGDDGQELVFVDQKQKHSGKDLAIKTLQEQPGQFL